MKKGFKCPVHAIEREKIGNYGIKINKGLEINCLQVNISKRSFRYRFALTFIMFEGEGVNNKIIIRQGCKKKSIVNK